MKNSKLGISLIANIVSMIVSLGISFFLTPYLLNKLGKETYAFYPIANNFVSYMTIITLALNSMASRFITIELEKGNKENVSSYVSTVFFANIFISAILLFPMVFIIYFINYILNIPLIIIEDVRILFVFIFLSMLVNLVFSVFGIATFAKNKMNLRAIQDIIVNITKVVLFIILYSFFEPNIMYMGIVSVVLALLSGTISLKLYRRLMSQYDIRIKYFRKEKVFELLGSGMWNSVNSIGSILLLSVSLILANIYIGTEASGNLSIVQTLPNLMTTVICVVYNVFLPQIAISYAHDKEETISVVKKSQKLLGMISSIPVVVIILLGEDFYRLWVPLEDAVYLQKLSIITVLPLLIHSSMWTVYGLNLVNNKVRIPAIMLIFTGTLSVFITILTLKYTNVGAVAIPIISSSFSILYYLVFIPSYAAKKMNESYFIFYPHILRTLIYAVINLVIGSIIIKNINVENWLIFFGLVVIFEIIGGILYGVIVWGLCDLGKFIGTVQALKRRKND